MSTTDTTDPPAGAAPSSPPAQRRMLGDDYADWILDARHQIEIRAAVRRADIPAVADRAYRYLARFWAPAGWLRTPVLIHAAAAATNIASPHEAGQTLGLVAVRLVRAEVLSTNSVAGRLLAVQRMDLLVARRQLAGLLHAAAANYMPVDWADLFRLYRGWDHPNLEIRRRVRRSLLEQFHTEIFD